MAKVSPGMPVTMLVSRDEIHAADGAWEHTEPINVPDGVSLGQAIDLIRDSFSTLDNVATA